MRKIVLFKQDSRNVAQVISDMMSSICKAGTYDSFVFDHAEAADGLAPCFDKDTHVGRFYTAVVIDNDGVILVELTSEVMSDYQVIEIVPGDYITVAETFFTIKSKKDGVTKLSKITYSTTPAEVLEEV